MTSGPLASKTTLPALKLVQSSRNARRLANALVVLLVLAIGAMAFLPWQQSARGTGKVVAYDPQQRQQTVSSPTKGIVARVGEGLFEGKEVKEGEFILEIQPTAANLAEQLNAQLQDLKAKLATAETKVEVYQQNIEDFAAARDYAVQAAQEMVEGAEAKLQAKQGLVPGYEAKEWQTRVNYERQRALFEKGLKPEKEIEKLKSEWDVAKAELEGVRREVVAAEKELEAKKHELEQKRREAQTKVEYARAMREDAAGQAATTRKEMRDVEIKLGELDRLIIEAPRDGTLFRMPVYERGQMVKEGDDLFTIVPSAGERAVELWVSGNDTPLIRASDDAGTPGDHVRLQFEGWPAVQFAGWPSVAVGTFGGQVVSIDATDDGTGKFRVLLKQEDDDPWPPEPFLRQGVRANGWVMLSEVSLGYEIWRQLNGFPPVVAKQAAAAVTKDEKKPTGRK
ncbi:MAG TPA: HlyD family efflux transporter periplasmic adaptor subunit [Candidatus Anammoximicrobium sp.]|nr:HlyD family efflux transporter periplasmic adaptor subunit [Candidatus Anammoximicrobium sp.]